MPIQSSIGETPDFASKSRQKAIRAIIWIMAVAFILRLAQLQLVQGSEYKLESDAQAIKRVRVEPFRGNMYDRNGELIVHNEPSFTITLTPNEFRREAMPLLCDILGMDSTEIDQIVKRYSNYSPFVPIKIYRDAGTQIVSQIEEYSDMLPGIEASVESKRLYEFIGNWAHLLGYSREITKSQLEKYPYYNPGDVIGQSGIEQAYEKFLRGQEGIKFVAVNKFGQQVASFDNGKRDLAASNGFDLYLSIDAKLQDKAEELLQGRRGAIVAIDPSSGEVMALASKPDFDPRQFSGKVSPQLFSELANDPASPLLHRAVMSQYPPGSTWKMLIAIAGLQEGVINENSTFVCQHGFTFGGRLYKCHGSHGAISVRRAIQTSCNAFFNQLALKLGQEKFEKYGKMFGFGQPTYIDIPNEKKGILPTREWLTKNYGQGGVSRGRLINYGIGQGEILATPLQMAVYTAAIANEGTYYQPHVVRGVENHWTHKIEEISFYKKELPINKSIFKIVKDGMFDVVNHGGTGGGSAIPGLDVCGKTGTAENPHGQDHAWFVCFAPKDNPKIALCVFVENAGFGGQVAAPIARELLMQYFYPERAKKSAVSDAGRGRDSNRAAGNMQD